MAGPEPVQVHDEPQALLTTAEAAKKLRLSQKGFKVLMRHLDFRPIRMGPETIRWTANLIRLTLGIIAEQPHLTAKLAPGREKIDKKLSRQIPAADHEN
jgi:predicted DNA-binding transcriptional regulator AlpA